MLILRIRANPALKIEFPQLPYGKLFLEVLLGQLHILPHRIQGITTDMKMLLQLASTLNFSDFSASSVRHLLILRYYSTSESGIGGFHTTRKLSGL